jgi:hypothetical protein
VPGVRTLVTTEHNAPPTASPWGWTSRIMDLTWTPSPSQGKPDSCPGARPRSQSIRGPAVMWSLARHHKCVRMNWRVLGTRRLGPRSGKRLRTRALRSQGAQFHGLPFHGTSQSHPMALTVHRGAAKYQCRRSRGSKEAETVSTGQPDQPHHARNSELLLPRRARATPGRSGCPPSVHPTPTIEQVSDPPSEAGPVSVQAT